jgi:hypothetical protein
MGFWAQTQGKRWTLREWRGGSVVGVPVSWHESGVRQGAYGSRGCFKKCGCPGRPSI